MKKLIQEIKACTLCSKHLELGPRPVLNAHQDSKIVIIGQAPGTAVHKSGVPWDDKSGENLRAWMDIDNKTFYDPKKIAIIPMGFCYPGRGKSGDLPPRPECAPQWHDLLFDRMNKVELTILIGMYAQKYYLGDKMERNLTETVRNYNSYLPDFFVLPHPSPRNNIWQAKNSWFKAEVLPNLKNMVKKLI